MKVLKICRDTTKVFEQLKELQENEGPQIRHSCEALRENLGSDDRFSNFGMKTP